MIGFGQRSTRCGQRRFTLVEMLVVITIIAILASLLMPQMQKALDASRSLKCLSNLKQLSCAVQSYAGDNQDCLPYSINPSASEWSYVLRIYGLDGRELWGRWSSAYYDCPGVDNTICDANRAYPFHRNYACNNMVMTNSADGAPLRAGKVRRPSQVAVLVDAPLYGNDYGCWYRIEPSGTPYLPWSCLNDADWNSPVPSGVDAMVSGQPNSIVYRHNGAVAGNVAHVDGSAKSYALYTFLKNNVFPFR